MRGWLLDTNVISELRKPNWDARVKAWADNQLPTSLYLSRVTIAEIRYGIDLFIAATAVLHDLCVVTRYASDFVLTGAPVLNPWTDTEPQQAE